MFEGLRSRWHIFEYNFSWDDYVPMLNGPAAKASLFIPIIGYALLFNDAVAEHLKFQALTNDIRTTVFINSDARLRFIFLGLLLLAAGNLLYRIWRPFALKLGETEKDYVNYLMENASAGTFLRLHLEHQRTGYDPLTQGGKYYTDDWELFWREAQWQGSGKGRLKKEDFNQDLVGYNRVDFSAAKQRHQSLLLDLLHETYFREARKKRFKLCLCLVVVTAGYILLVIPSLDLCIRVLELIVLEPVFQSPEV